MPTEQGTIKEAERRKTLVERALKKLTKPQAKAMFEMGAFLSDPLTKELLLELAK